MLNKTESSLCLSLDLFIMAIPLELVINLDSQILSIGYRIDLCSPISKLGLASVCFSILNIWSGSNNQRLRFYNVRDNLFPCSQFCKLTKSWFRSYCNLERHFKECEMAVSSACMGTIPLFRQNGRSFMLIRNRSKIME